MAAALAQGDVIIDRGPDAVPVSPRARPLIVNHLNWYEGEKHIPGKSRLELQVILDHGQTRQIKIEQVGEVDSYLDGGVRRISTRGVCRRLIALAILSHPLDGPELKVRQPPGRYQSRPRPRTQQELEGLRRGNARRAEEARKRREAKPAARV